MKTDMRVCCGRFKVNTMLYGLETQTKPWLSCNASSLHGWVTQIPHSVKMNGNSSVIML